MIVWGVRVEGSSVLVCADGPSAFREESVRRAYGDASAVAVWSDGGGWHVVQWGSSLRPDPWPPAQARGLVEVWRRRGRRWAWFRRRPF